MALNSRDVQKILNLGFTIIREDRQNTLIKCKTPKQAEWHTLHKGFSSIAAMRRQMDELLKDSATIED